MVKYLVYSDEEFLALFKDLEWSETEILLGIEFAMADGRYHSDIDPDDEPDDLSVSETVFRKLNHADFPTHYPCLVMLWIEDTFDRLGDVKIRLVEHIYLEDFNEALRTHLRPASHQAH